MTNFVKVELSEGVATVTLANPPFNFLNPEIVSEYRKALESLDDNPECRAIVLASEGAVFCAGADFSQVINDIKNGLDPSIMLGEFYSEVRAMFHLRKPMVAAVEGPAIGAGLGLALLADFRISCPKATFAANFNRLGIHPGFGLSATLPRLIGTHNAELLFYTGRRVKGNEAKELGLLTELVDQDDVLARAHALAREIALSAPIAVMDTRSTMRQGLAEQVRIANIRELEQQTNEMKTLDFAEGIAASAARRDPAFKGQ